MELLKGYVILKYMGFLSKFKDLFNKNIECGDEIDSHILIFLKKKKHLYLNKNIIVRDNSNCVIVYKGRVCDVLTPGKYKITKESVEECYERAKIEKKEEKGIKIKKIRVDLYYINTTEFSDFEFISNTPFVVKHKDLGRVKGCLGGKCTIRVIDPTLFMKTMLSRQKKVNSKIVPELISEIVGCKINKKFEKSKIPFDMLVTNLQQTNAILNGEVEDTFDKQGMFVKNINLKSINIANKHKEKVNTYIATHKRVVQPTNVSKSMWTVAETVPVGVKEDNNKFCYRCGFSNNLSDLKCKKCGNKLD